MSYSPQRVSNAHVERECGTHACAGRAFPSDSLKIGPPDWNCRLSLSLAARADVWQREGSKRGRDPGLSPRLCSLIPRKTRFAGEDEDTRVPPLVSHVTGDATVCNRRSSAAGLISETRLKCGEFLRRGFKPTASRDGIFQSKIRISVRGLFPPFECTFYQAAGGNLTSAKIQFGVGKGARGREGGGGDLIF